MWEPDQMTFCDHPVSYGPRVWFDFKVGYGFFDSICDISGIQKLSALKKVSHPTD